jgi:hypothetical protein
MGLFKKLKKAVSSPAGILATGGLGLLASNNLFDSNTTSSAGLLDPGQQNQLNMMTGLNQQYMGGTYSTLNNLATNAQSAYTPISDQYYQDVIANPYLAQQDAAWQENAGKASLGGNLHSSALTRQKSMFDTDTATNLLQQKRQLFEQERQSQMAGQENAYTRQLQALQGMSGLFGTALGTQAKENIVTQNQGLLSQLMPLAAGAKLMAGG